jgi:hypothetical protein
VDASLTLSQLLKTKETNRLLKVCHWKSKKDFIEFTFSKNPVGRPRPLSFNSRRTWKRRNNEPFCHSAANSGKAGITAAALYRGFQISFYAGQENPSPRLQFKMALLSGSIFTRTPITASHPKIPTPQNLQPKPLPAKQEREICISMTPVL